MTAGAALVAMLWVGLAACGGGERVATREASARDAGVVHDAPVVAAPDAAVALVPAPRPLTTPTPPWPDEIGLSCAAGYREVSDSCAVCSTGAVHCWGQANTLTFRGQASRTFRDDVVALSDLPSATAMVATEQGGCILATDATVQCWGILVSDLRRSRKDKLELVTIATPSPAVQLVAGGSHVCARGRDGEVTCWGGWNDYGQLGPEIPSLDVHELPRTLPDLRVSAIASGATNVCAIATDGQVWCWGAPPSIGDLHESNHTVAPVRGMTGARAVTMDSYESCALRDDGSIWCWGVPCAQRGKASSNMLAFQRRVMRARPRKIATAPWATQLALGRDGPIAVDTDGHAFTFDRGGARVPVPGLAPVQSVTTAGCGACAVLRTGELRCWGNVSTLVRGAADATPP